MFGIGFPELIVICIVALIFIGPKKLPDLMRQGGKLFVQLRRTANDVRSTFDQVVHEAEEEVRRSEAEALRQAILADHVKSPKLLDAAATSTSAPETHDHSDPYHHEDVDHMVHHHLEGSDDHQSTTAADTPQDQTPHGLDPHRPDGAQPFQPHLLGSTGTAKDSPRETKTPVPDGAAKEPTAADTSASPSTAAEAPTKPKDSPVS